MDTIYALSTAVGKAAIAIIRVSGHATDAILEKVCKRVNFVDRRPTLARLFDSKGDVVDTALVIRFESPRTFTGEHMIEFHVTGGRAVVSSLLHTLGSCPGTRPAHAGEFARRAFENGKLDLTQVEGIAAAVEADTRAQLRHATTLMSGHLGRESERIRRALLTAKAQLETTIDFSDVEEAHDVTMDQILAPVNVAASALEEWLQGSRVSERLRHGMTVAIAGLPNVGKSTLLNFLARKDISIVSPLPGTTRDALEFSADVGGFPITFIDTAGLRDSSDPIEAEGISRAKERCANADLVLWLSVDGNLSRPPDSTNWPILEVQSKSDLATRGDRPTRLSVSAKTGEGISDLLDRIQRMAADHFRGAGSVCMATERQQYAAREALSYLRQIISEPDRQAEFIADDLRLAINALGRISGQIGVEEVLGEIFSRLCVGK